MRWSVSGRGIKQSDIGKVQCLTDNSATLEVSLLIFQATNWDDIDAILAAVAVLSTRKDNKQIRFANGDLLLVFVVLNDEAL